MTILTPLLELKGITKRFPGVLANDSVDLRIFTGEVHGLLGENGAGKSTLMKILYGLYQADAGEIRFKGRPVYLRSPKDALSIGIGMVHQHFKLVPTLTVAENIILGIKQDKTPWLRLHDARKSIAQLSWDYGLHVDSRAPVWALSTGEQQRVEILKALYRKAELLILDEPTAVLTPQESQALFGTLKHLVDAGLTIIFITHKLKEIIAVSHNVSVLRRGKLLATKPTAQTTKEELAQLMVGRAVLFQVDKQPCRPGAPVLQMENVEACNDRQLPALRAVTLTIRSGEVLGIAGVSGNGQRELAEVVAGLRPATGGRIRLEGQDVTNAPVRRLRSLGMAHIPEDRMGQGLALSLSVAENMVLHSYCLPEFRRGPFLNHGAIDDHARQLVENFDVRTAGVHVPAQQLSGGNLQKVILARELHRQPRLIVANQPTRGLDVGSCEYVRRKLIEARDQGTAVLLISEDLDEVLDVCDRVAVIYEGHLSLAPPGANHQLLGLMMAGEDVTHGTPVSS